MRNELETASKNLAENQSKNKKFSRLLQEENGNLSALIKEKDQLLSQKDQNIRDNEK